MIKDSLQKPDWKLENETKTIGRYTCFKATLTEEIEQRSLTTINGEEGEEEVKKVERVTTAWYTLDIPVNHGPDRFWGLPGLIMEINDGKQVILCAKVVLNPKEKINIEEPDKGKEVTTEEFSKISLEKTKELRERYQSNRSGDGNSFEIRIGG